MNDQDPIESIEPGQLPPDPYNPLTKLREDQSNAWEPRCIAAAWECRTNDRAQYEELVNVLREKKFKRLTEWEQAVKQFGAQQKRQAKEVVDRLRVISSQAPANEHRELTDLEQRHTREAQEYRMSPGSIWWQGGPQGQWLRIANFSAVITHEFVDNDGLKTTRSCEIEAIVGPHKTTYTIVVSASEYPRMEWVGSELGAEAVIAAGSKTKDVLRAAIQTLSIPIARKMRFGFTGWHHHQHHGWIYLHSKGAEGSTGPVEGVTVNAPPEVSKYALSPPDENIKTAVLECLELLFVEPMVTVPVFGAVWRAALGTAPVTVYIASKTKVGKSMLAGLAVQHFAPWHHGRRPPARWTDSSKALMRKLSSAGDSLMLVDDFVLKGTGNDQTIIQKADDVIRAQYSDVGRAWLTKDNKMAGERPSRCVLLVTGETLAPGQSLRSRSIVVHLSGRIAKDLNTHKLHADAGVYSGVVCAFVRWLAPYLEDTRHHSEKTVRTLVKQWVELKADERTGGIAAEIAVGIKLFLQWCLVEGFITDEQGKAYWSTVQETLLKVVQAQAEHDEDPATWFVDLLKQAIAGGAAHACSEKDVTPEHAKHWGWDLSGERPRGKGEKVGWTNGEDLWILPAPALRVARSLAQSCGKPLILNHEDLGSALNDAGLLVQTDPDRRSLFVRKMVNRVSHNTYRLKFQEPLVSQEDDTTDVD